MSKLREFLERNSVTLSGTLPWVHTTVSYTLDSAWHKRRLKAAPCDVFIGEKLLYFFLGRPAYKKPAKGAEPKLWELPCCFIVQFDQISNYKRLYPFDSGAAKRGMLPDYINLMPLDEFEGQDAETAPQRIIGAFYDDVDRYMTFRPNSVERMNSKFSLGPFDSEIKALVELAHEKNGDLDARRLTIEAQINSDLELKSSAILAIVCPQPYLDDKEFREFIEVELEAQPIGYEVVPFDVPSYYKEIHTKVLEFYRLKGLIK